MSDTLLELPSFLAINDNSFLIEHMPMANETF